MKNFISVLVLMTLLLTSYAQKQSDKIYFHNGDIMDATIMEVAQSTIVFKYFQEEVVNSMNKLLISKIVFSSGREQKISDFVEIKGEEDWEKVTLTDIQDEIKGLVKKGEVSGKATGAWGAASNATKVYAKAIEKLKRQAAIQGAFIIYSKDLIVKDGDIISGQWAKSVLKGITYGYK